MSLRSLLVISAAPDGRPSSATLMALLSELRRRPDVRTSLWYLRAGDGEAAGADRVVDDLRTAQPAALADAMGLGRVASALRGRRLRRWWNQIDPDAVVLDDGLGARLLRGRSVVTAVRVNVEDPPDLALEGQPLSAPDLWILPEEVERPDARAIRTRTRLKDLHAWLQYAEEPVRARLRRRLGLPEGLPLVVGWGVDPRLDGLDVFVRALWSLEHDHGVEAHGAWIGAEASDEELAALDAEARRCGLAGRITHVSAAEREARFCGDVVLISGRMAEPAPLPIDEVLVTGAQVVATRAAGLTGPGIVVIDDLDAQGAGDALACCLAADRTQVAGELSRAYHVGPLADDLLASLEGLRRDG